MLWLSPPAASPAAGCPRWPPREVWPGGGSPPSARLHSAVRAVSAEAPQSAPSARQSPPQATRAPGNADGVLSEGTPNPGSLSEEKQG